MKRLAFGLVVSLLLSALCGAGCIPHDGTADSTHLERARAAARGSRDAERVGRWLLAELVAPKGKVAGAEQARKRLAELGGGGLDASLARAIDHDVHGRFVAAAGAYLTALQVAQQATSEADLVGWFVANRLTSLRGAVPGMWQRARPVVAEAIADPGRLGWRARAELVEWWTREAYQDVAGPQGDALLDQVADKHGCLRQALLAGPFGRGAVADHRVHFDAEQPAPWPARFAAVPDQAHGARTHATAARGCLLTPQDGAPPGIYYVQSFVDLDAVSDVIVAVQGAYALFVDDVQVLDRDMSKWGVWPRFGVRLRLEAGRHRILARLLKPETSIRLLGPTGAPLGLVGSAEQGAPYSLTPPRLLPDPNVLEPFVRAAGVAPAPGAAALRPEIDLDHPVSRYLAAYLAHVEGQDDLASVIFEPLVKNQADATPVVLAQQAVFVDGDSIYTPAVARDLARDLRQQAVATDEALWGPALWLVLEKGDKSQPSALVTELEELSRRFLEVPMVALQLATAFARLGWKVEEQGALEQAAERFPDNVDVLEALLSVYEARGERQRADALARRILEIDPTEEVELRRALERRDYVAAIAELRRIGQLRGDRKDIALRIADLMVRAGKSSESISKLELALESDPGSAGSRLALADARYAGGDRQALVNALVEAIRTGSEDGALRTAIELVDGVTDLEPYRRDGLQVIDDSKSQGLELPGASARILDYSALWVAEDGSARMLEHEIVRIQSREGIAKHVEQPIPRGQVLTMRTIKQDGTVLEPELVAGKPTVTMPHLEVGDYVETESIWYLRATAPWGRRFLSPRWYFREENTSYHVSEFVVVTPEGREVEVETTGQVPEPTIDRLAGLTVRRWRVEGSPALPEEPLSAPVQEFLPSVRVGWGIELDAQLRRLVLLQSDHPPADPRMVRIARTIVSGKLDAKMDEQMRAAERGRRIYRWVLDTIQPGEENAGPRVITGKSGDRTVAFIYLCRLAGLDARIGLVRDRLSPEPRGPFSKAETYSVPAVRVAAAGGNRWLVVADRFAPYGYLPSSLRGQPAVLLQAAQPITSAALPPLMRETTSTEGAESRIDHRGEVDLHADGSATMRLEQHYDGRYAVQLRSVLSNVPAARRQDVVEAQLLGLALPGGRVTELDLPNLDALDEPVKLSMTIEVPNLARVAAGELVLEVPFLGSIARLVQLPTRETPLYISERMATRTLVDLRVKLPAGARVEGTPPQLESSDSLVAAVVRDRVEGEVLHVEREIHIPAGRVQPEAYPSFRAAVLSGDEALNRKVRVKLR